MKTKTCPTCKGSKKEIKYVNENTENGIQQVPKEYECSTCHGAGVVPVDENHS